MKKNYIFTLLLAFCFSNLSFGQYSDLFISMYAEGSSNNKFIEIYNGTGSSVDLSDYMIKGSNNGGDWKGERDLALTGTLVDGEVYVISTDQADASILAVADLALPYESALHYNGDDAIGLFKKDSNGDFNLIDIVGVPTVDPGSGWDVAGVTNATKDHTLTRKNSISGPNVDWANSSGTDVSDSEWVVTDSDSEWANLGSYTPSATEPCTTDATQSAAGVAAFDLTMGSALTVLEDGATFEIIDNPDFDNAVNTSCKVGKVTKLGAQNWDNTQIDFDSKFDFSTTNAITIKVWSAQADTEVRIKLEEIGNSGNNLEKFQTTSVTNGWEELTFEYTSANSNKYDKFVIFFNLNALDSNTYYFDDLKLATVTEPCTTDATQSAAGVAAFDLTMGSALTVLEDGATFEIIDNPDFDNTVNTSCKVGKVTKLGAQNWDNTQIDFDSKFDFSTTNAITIKVWSAQADTEVRIKLEEIGNSGNNLEKFQTTSVTNGWEELTFEYTSANSNKYDKFVIFFNLNALDSNTYYFDDLKLATVTEPCTTDATQSAAGVAAFDLTMGSALTVLEDGATFEIIDNPDFDNTVNTSCKVGKVTKLGAQNWDNTQIDFDSKFDFSTTNAITIKVWSAQADTEVRIKLEEIGNSGNNLEKFQTTSVTNGWEELTFEYTSANSNKYDKFVIFFNLNALDSNTYYFDDLKLATVTEPCTTDATQSAAGVAAFDLTMGSALTVLEDGATFEIIDNPDFDNTVNTSCKVGKVTKLGAQNWDNTQIDFDSKFDFSTTNAITIKVWSAQADTEVRIKLEEIGNSGNNLEKFQTTSVTNGWEELTFEYTSTDSNKYDKFVIFFNLNALDSNTYYFDDLKLVTTTESCTTDATQSAAGVAAFDLTMGSALTVLEDGATFEIIDNPDFDNTVNTSCKVGKVTKLGAQNWDNTQIDFDSKFDFSTTNAITIKVWSAQADTEVRIKLEEIGNSGNNLEKFQTTSVTNGWEELTFEYTSADSNKYDKFVIFFNLNALDSNTYYFDDLKLVTTTESCTTDATQSAAGVAAFDLTMGSALTVLEDGATFEIIDNPDFDNTVNTSCKVGKVTKLGAQNWDNTQIDFDSKFDFSTTNAITIKVWSAQADTEVRIKLEEIGNSGNNLEKFQTTSVTNGWEELTFEYTSTDSNKYDKFVIFFNLNALDSNTYYFDDLKLVETGGTSDGDYCEKVVAHLGLSDQAASEIKLTVVNSGEKSMKVTIESNNDDAVDLMEIPGDVTGSPTQSAVDSSVAGKMSITLTWPETAPADVALNILWSKVSTGGNWQLGEAPTTFKFDATCATASIDDKLLVSFSMYPNPASSSLNISASSMIKNAVIYNILGKQVMNLSINKNSESINVSNLASGMYLIKYTTESAVGTAKFIKQ